MKLSLDELSILKKDYENQNAIGIFSKLKEKDGKVNIDKAGKELLKIVANPERSSRVVLQENDYIVEKYGYFKNGETVLAENVNGEIELSQENEIRKAVIQFTEFIGMSQIKRANVEIALSRQELLVLMALLDIYREKRMLTNCGKESEFSATFAEIRGHLEKPLDSALVMMLKTNYKMEVPKIEETKPILNAFTEKGIVTFNKNFTLNDEYAYLGNTFLMPQTIITAEALELTGENKLVSTGALYMSAGLKDNVLFIFGADAIEFSTVSSRYMIDMIEEFLKCPKIV